MIEGSNARSHLCRDGLHPGEPCRPFCYMTEMTARGWQLCPHLDEEIC